MKIQVDADQEESFYGLQFYCFHVCSFAYKMDSGSLGWPHTHCVAEGGLEHPNLCFLGSWDYVVLRM